MRSRGEDTNRAASEITASPAGFGKHAWTSYREHLLGGQRRTGFSYTCRLPQGHVLRSSPRLRAELPWIHDVVVDPANDRHRVQENPHPHEGPFEVDDGPRRRRQRQAPRGPEERDEGEGPQHRHRDLQLLPVRLPLPDE